MKPNESPADSAPQGAQQPAGAPQGAPQPASPFPPAFRWDASPAEAPTRVMNAPKSDNTQGRDLFQPFSAPPDEPASKASEASAPPWAEEDLPPIAEHQSAWPRQGPEVFTAPATRPRSKQIIGITVLAVVVLGLVFATVAYFLTSGPPRISSDQIPAPQPTTAFRALPAPPAPLPPPVDTAHALSDPPGQARGGGGLFDLPQLRSTGLLRPHILSALQAGEMIDGVLKTTTLGANTIGMFALTLPDQKTATTVAQRIATEQLDGGLKADDNRALQGVAVMGSAARSNPTVYRAVYVLYNRAIFLEVFGPNRDAVLASFDSLLTQQVSYAPPTVRVGR